MIGSLNRILCPVDFSGPSTAALTYAAALARWQRAGLTALYVHQIQMSPLLAVGPYVGPVAPVVLSSGERTLMEESLTRMVVAAVGDDVPVTTALIEDANVPAAIVSHAAAMRADLVVVGTQGHSGVARLVLGSVAERVLRSAPCPVVTVPPGARRGLSPESVREVLCPTDFSPGSAAALDWAAAWAAKAAARLTALHVVELPPQLSDPPPAEYAGFRARLIEDARQVMGASIPELIQQSSGFETQLAVGRPGPEILRLADTRQADLIVMGVRGRNAVDLAVFGSATQHVVRRAACPVLAVHSQPPAVEPQ